LSDRVTIAQVAEEAGVSAMTSRSSTSQARLVLDPAFAVGPVDPRLFGSFVEHVGRCVYTGIYEPGHPATDPDGLRTDVLALIRELGVTVIRYPGGNFVSGYNWEDGVGPAGQRPSRLDPAWRQTTFYPFALASRYGRGTVLTAEPECHAIRTACHGDVPALHATAVIDDRDETITVFAVNRDRAAPLELLTEFRGFRPAKVLEHRVLADPDEDARNTAEYPHRVTPMTLNSTRITEGSAHVVLPPMSWNLIRFA
jgi:alpha-L-arabinofuranosidase